MGSFFRVFSFMGQVMAMVTKNPTLLVPLAANLAIATGVNIVLVLIMALVPGDMQFLGYALYLFGLSVLYFIDYFSAGLNTSMVFEQVTTGTASVGSAFTRTLKSIVGIVIFAVVSAIFDALENLAHQQRGAIKQILIGILRSVWTTATYVIMPAMIIENLGFVDSFKRSKALVERDPTQVGVGVVGLGLVTWLLGVGTVVLGGMVLRAGYAIHPAVGLGLSLLISNVFWSFSAYLKSTYYTCFYLWARECERQGSANPAFAPEPLRNVLPQGAAAGNW